jgi:hypothetical protein
VQLDENLFVEFVAVMRLPVSFSAERSSCSASNDGFCRSGIFREGFFFFFLISKKSEESIDHLLLHCEVARDFWSYILILFGVEWVMPQTVLELLNS